MILCVGKRVASCPRQSHHQFWMTNVRVTNITNIASNTDEIKNNLRNIFAENF